MGGGGSQANVSTYDVDQKKLQEFMNSGAGKAYAGQYDPNQVYEQDGKIVYSSRPGETMFTQAGDERKLPTDNPSRANRDVTTFMNAYQVWLKGDTQTAANWQDYAAAVDANKGGEGDNTITEGAAMSQRQQLLGTLANPNVPATGLGTYGSSAQKLGSLKK